MRVILSNLSRFLDTRFGGYFFVHNLLQCSIYNSVIRHLYRVRPRPRPMIVLGDVRGFVVAEHGVADSPDDSSRGRERLSGGYGIGMAYNIVMLPDLLDMNTILGYTMIYSGNSATVVVQLTPRRF